MKAEAVKLPGAGISPKQCPRKCAAEKGLVPALSEIGSRGRSQAADMNCRRHEVDDRSANDDPKRVRFPKNDEKHAGNYNDGRYDACHGIMRQRQRRGD